MKWIKVEDKLPDEGSEVLVYGGPAGEMWVSIFEPGDDGRDWYSADFDYTVKGVTHWMPLPDKPK